MATLPLPLRHALESGNCVLFIGAGIGEHLRRPDGSSAPTAAKLAEEMAEHFGINADGYFDLAQISQIVEIKKGRKELDTFVKSRLLPLEPDSTFQWLFTRRWKAIYTTNYDHCIERSYDLNPNPVQTPVSLSVTQDLVSVEPLFQVRVVHLHGTVFASDNPRLIITEEDYIRFRERRRMLFELLKLDASTSTILYVGYSNRDPNWKLVISEIGEEFYPSKLPAAYRISPAPPSLEDDILQARGVTTIRTSMSEFVASASSELQGTNTEYNFLNEIEKSVPSALSHLFRENPPATTRLLQSWTYVNGERFDEHPNLADFLKGNHPNWSLIAGNHYFQRDIEDDAYDQLLDYATNRTTSPGAMTILGAAGYGVSTLLQTLAVKLIKDRAGAVFYLRPGSRIAEGDIQYAISAFPEQRVFFFIDNAADLRREVQNALTRLRQTRHSAMLICGSRLNEWQEEGGSTIGIELGLPALSDAETERLLDFLQVHNALGVLQPLSRDLQVAAVRHKHGQQLLVAMRELTEGPGFDAIIEGEFRNIRSATAKRAYLTVCALYQNGVLLRDRLLCDILEIPPNKLYSEIGASTDGVIVFDCLDKFRGIYGARARHRTIAEIVWMRCGQESEQEDLIQKALKHINLNYQLDKDAFEQLVRNDALVDSIGNLEGKIRYFDTACKKDPESPYVRQHYARMLAREERWELALAEIDYALNIGPRVRVLYHTKGKILSALCTATQSEDLARKRLAQAEDSFKRGLRLQSNDEYCLQGLAELYFEWAKRAKSTSESSDYMGKAEDVIRNGMRSARSREALRVLSSKIAEWLGKSVDHVRALETAVKEYPSGIVARFLLGRTYRRSGRFQEACAILEGLVRDHPEEVRSSIQLAKCYIEMNNDAEKAIAVLRLSSLHGLTDLRYISILGGLLFISGEFSEADDVFKRSWSLGLSYSAAHRVEFRPANPAIPGEPFQLQGVIAKVLGNNAWIDAQGYPRIFAPGSSWYGTRLTRGLRVEFDLVFTAGGAQAEKVRRV